MRTEARTLVDAYLEAREAVNAYRVANGFVPGMLK